MQQPGGDAHEHIIEKLDLLNETARRQLSLWYVLRNGVIYGIGFIVGSTVLTALVVTIVLKFFGGTILADVISWIAHSGR